MLYIPFAGIFCKGREPPETDCVIQNPEFYARQGMRLSTYNIPRIISCADMEEDYIAMPRGCEDAVVTLLEDNQVTYRIEDKTNQGKNITVEFKGNFVKNRKRP